MQEFKELLRVTGLDGREEPNPFAIASFGTDGAVSRIRPQLARTMSALTVHRRHTGHGFCNLVPLQACLMSSTATELAVVWICESGGGAETGEERGCRPRRDRR